MAKASVDDSKARRGLVYVKPIRLTYFRKAQGLSQRQLAAQARCSNSLVALIEKGQRQPNPDIALNLAAALDLDFEVLGDWSEKGLRWRAERARKAAELEAAQNHYSVDDEEGS